MSRILKTWREVSLLAYPPPYRSWFTLSSDPDHTTIDGWQETHAFVWEELGLPLADSFFISNKNLQYPDQLTLIDFPQCIKAHPHDTMHTWGDFIFSGDYRFTRNDALEASAVLTQHDIAPLIWTDHSNFIGNLIHRAHVKAVPTLFDTSGQKYGNDLYTLDLVKKAGVKYIWDGYLTKNIIGQDRTLNRFQWYQESTSKFGKAASTALAITDKITQPFAEFRNNAIFNFNNQANRQYSPIEFPDGSKFYIFKRYGSWRLGDIDGIAKVLTERTLKTLDKAQGTMVLYTHLGKRNTNRPANESHLTSATKVAFQRLADLYRQKRINVSATSKLLDYLVLRDNIEVVGNEIHFRADGIRYKSLDLDALKGHEFGLILKNDRIKVFCDGNSITEFDIRSTEKMSVLSFGTAL